MAEGEVVEVGVVESDRRALEGGLREPSGQACDQREAIKTGK
jgi:hypothetical protein